MIVYRVMPIDFWQGWRKPEDLFREAVHDHGTECHDPEDWSAMWAKAKMLASLIGWDGDARMGPLVSVLPELPGVYDMPPVVIAWKQQSGGVSFVASPFELPWLSEHCHSRIEG